MFSGDLFEQIFASEQKALESKSLLSEVKSKITACDERIKEIQSEIRAKHRENTHKVLAWHEQEENIKSLNAKQEILRQQKEQHQQERKGLEAKLSELAECLERRQEEFCSKVQTFSASFDLVATAQQQRLKRATEELHRLQQHELLLTKDMLAFNQRKSSVRSLTNGMTGLEQELQWKKKTLLEREKTLALEQSVLEDLIKEKDNVASVPQCDAEFLQLQGELEECRHDDMEGVCAVLEKELQELQRHQWQVQAQQQQQRQMPQRHVKDAQVNPSQSGLNTSRNVQPSLQETQIPRCGQQQQQQPSQHPHQLPITSSSQPNPAHPQNPQRWWRFQRPVSQADPSDNTDSQRTNVQRLNSFRSDNSSQENGQ